MHGSALSSKVIATIAPILEVALSEAYEPTQAPNISVEGCWQLIESYNMATSKVSITDSIKKYNFARQNQTLYIRYLR